MHRSYSVLHLQETDSLRLPSSPGLLFSGVGSLTFNMCKGFGAIPATCIKRAKDIKHKMSLLLQNPEAEHTDQKQPKEKTDAAKSTLTAAEVKKWKDSFGQLMDSERGRTTFRIFLKSEFSEENMEFWLACEDYKKTRTSMLPSKAKQIFLQYMETDSPSEVNLDAATSEETRQNLLSPCHDSYDAAQKMIYNLMEKDSYRRFLNSKLIPDLLQTQAEAPTAQKKKKGKNNSDCAENSTDLSGGA